MLGILRRAYRVYSQKKLKKRIVNSHHDVTAISRGVFDGRKYDFSLSESNIYKLDETNYKEYINTWESYQPRVKQTPYFVMSDDKYVFSMTFGNYIEVPKTYAIIQNGRIVAVNENISEENLYDFLVMQNGGVIKDRCGCDGFGIYVLMVSDGMLIYRENVISKEQLLEIVSEFKNGIIQARFEQCNFENELFGKSINTVRVVSIKKKDEDCHEIVAALQRIGTDRSAPVDNFNQGGGSALIDIETGEIGSMTCIDSFDEDGNRIFYEKHPDSGIQIKGKVLPYWSEIKEKIIDVTRKMPFFEYIAWDIVVKEDGIALIETNMKSSLNVFQVHGGMRNDYLGQKYREHGYIKG